MKNLRLLGFLMILASSSLLINCTSDNDPIPGPPGADGTDGIDGVDSTTDCRECHSYDYREPIQLGYLESTHFTGGHVYGTETDGRDRCARCHSNEGFIDQIEYGATKEGGYNLVTPISCTGCHFEHRSFNFDEDGNDFAVRTIDPVKLIIDPLLVIDLKNDSDVLGLSNLCVNCHQPRASLPIDDGTGNFDITSGHWGTHHNPQATMFEGIAGVLIPGSLDYPDRAESPHREGSSCTNCHMHKSTQSTAANHTFKPAIAACIDCHEELTGSAEGEFDRDGFQTEVEDKLAELAVLLADVEGVDSNGNPITGIIDDDKDPVPGTYPILGAQAAWNFIFVYKDESLGIHNPDMVKALLQNSIEALQNQ